MGKVLAVCTSERKGLQKHDVHSAHFDTDWGINGDAHAGKWHRQISLLSADAIEAFNRKGADVIPGAFGENLVVEGFDFRALPVGTLLRCGNVLLEMTQIGKECHSHCEIYKKMGDCIMPREGVFARVLEPGTISVGDEMVIVERDGHFPWQAAVITFGNSGACGDSVSESGSAVSKRLRENGYEVVEQFGIPSDARVLKQQLIRLCDQRQLDIIITTGGNSRSLYSDVPETAISIADKQLSCVSGAMCAVIRRKTLIINLSDDAKACMEGMDKFMDTLPHTLGLLRGEVHD